MAIRILALWLTTVCVASAASWEIRTIAGRESVPVDQVTAFYGVGMPAVSGRSLTAVAAGKSMQFRLNSREAILNGVRQWLAFPVIADDGRYWISRMDVTRTVDPVFRPEAVEGLRNFNTVVLDPGHGGDDKGASSSFGLEKEFALDLARRVRSRLENAGLKVVLTRSSDVFIPLESRPAVAKRYSSSIFVSLHFNDASWKPSANGIEIFCIPPRGTPPSGQQKLLARDNELVPGHGLEGQNFALANAVFTAMRGRLPLVDRGVKRARFKVLQLATVPAVLIEGGFLTNPTEAKRIASPDWREGLAEAITSGILEYRALAAARKTPRTVEQWGGKPTKDFISED